MKLPRPRGREPSKGNRVLKTRSPKPPVFDDDFRCRLRELFLWRRDVRSFAGVPVAAEVVEDLLACAALAPSVGYSQPWRFVIVEDRARRRAILRLFEAENERARREYDCRRGELYGRLKLSGLDRAPVQIAVFVNRACREGHRLGTRTMPETLAYSAVMAVHTLWLEARARGLGLGWVSILDPGRVREILEVPDTWSLVAYLCLGVPAEESPEPELRRARWQGRVPLESVVVRR